MTKPRTLRETRIDLEKRFTESGMDPKAARKKAKQLCRRGQNRLDEQGRKAGKEN